MAANLSRERMRGSIREERKILVPQQTLIRGEECAFFIRGEREDSLLFKGLLDSYVLIRRKWRKDEIRNHAER